MADRQDISKSRPDSQNASALLISGQTAVKGKVIVMVIFAPEYEGGMTDRRLITCEKVNSVWDVEITKGEMFDCYAGGRRGTAGLSKYASVSRPVQIPVRLRSSLRPPHRAKTGCGKSAVPHGMPGQAWRKSGRRPSAKAQIHCIAFTYGLEGRTLQENVLFRSLLSPSLQDKGSLGFAPQD